MRKPKFTKKELIEVSWDNNYDNDFDDNAFNIRFRNSKYPEFKYTITIIKGVIETYSVTQDVKKEIPTNIKRNAEVWLFENLKEITDYVYGEYPELKTIGIIMS